jgi:hypothetical protein
MQHSMVPQQGWQPAWMGSLTQRLRRSGWAAREQLAQYVSEIAAYWNRQPLDRFWPPHP